MSEQRLTCSSDPGLAKNDRRGGTVAATGQMNPRAAVAVQLAGLPLSLPTSEPAADHEQGGRGPGDQEDSAGGFWT